MQILVHISIGELLDKISILEIKIERIRNADKIIMATKEYNILLVEMKKIKDFPNELYQELKKINETLWDIEDRIREKEAKHKFDQEFIELARSVYFTNDQRGELKKKINEYFNCEIQEVKEYKKYDHNKL